MNSEVCMASQASDQGLTLPEASLTSKSVASFFFIMILIIFIMIFIRFKLVGAVCP